MDIFKTLQGRIDELEALALKLQKRLNDAPAGVLLSKTSNGHQSHYLRCESRATLEYLGRDKEPLIDPRYAVTSKEKVEWFAAYGIVPGRRLIVTFETSTSPLNTRYVDKLIELYLK